MNQSGVASSQVLEPGSNMEISPLDIKRSRRPLRARLARWGVMLIIFMAGGVAGYSVGTARLLQPETPTTGVWNRPDRFTDYLLGQLKKDLSLTEAQYPEVKKILVRHHEEFNKLRLETQPLFEAQMAKLQREMQAVLDPAQWTRYKEQLDRMRNRRRGPPSGGPGRGGSGRDGGHRERGPGERGPSERGPGERGPGDRSDRSPRDARDSQDQPHHGRPPEERDGAPPKVEPQQAEPAPKKPADAN